MRNLKGYIAVLLFGIFVYPMVFHVLHLDAHSSSEVSSCQHTSISLEADWTSSLDVDHSEDCAVCDFEFFVNDEPQPVSNVVAVDISNYHYFIYCSSHYGKNTCSTKSPRGPPALFA